MGMNNLNCMLMADFYKISHRESYPEGITKVYSTWTPRTSRLEYVNEVVAFGFQSFIKNYLVNFFNENFFEIELKWQEYKDIIKSKGGFPMSFYEEIFELRKRYKAGEKVSIV